MNKDDRLEDSGGHLPYKASMPRQHGVVCREGRGFEDSGGHPHHLGDELVEVGRFVRE